MSLRIILENFLHPPVLFFFLGMLAVVVKSDLEIPPQIGKFLSLYLLFDIGFKGGVELSAGGFSPIVIYVILVCALASFIMPFVIYPFVKRKLNGYNAGALAATYGSISAVTFATAITFLEANHIKYGGYLVAGMAIMESPAIISGLILIRRAEAKALAGNPHQRVQWNEIIRESVFNGSVLLLVGSLLIGLLTGRVDKMELEPFTGGIFKGMLCLYMLDMGLIAARRLNELRRPGVYLSVFALVYPLIGATTGILASAVIGLSIGDALLLTILFASASYIVVPAAMRLAVPQVNLSVLLPTSLGLTFTFNIALGIPLYYMIINAIWA